MTDKQKEAIEYFKKRIDICMENANICDDNDFDEEATCLRKEQILTETVLTLIQTQQAEIEYYKKQKIYDEQFKHELLEEIRCKGLTIDSLNKILDDRLICIQGGRGLYAKLKGLDKEYLIREYLSMYKMCKAEIEKKNIELIEAKEANRQLSLKLQKKDKIIDLILKELYKKAHISTKCYLQKSIKECLKHKNCIECLKQYFERKVETEEK